jgi:serine/threonine protein kinase
LDAPDARHPTDQVLRDHRLRRLDDRSAESLNRHLDSCPDCRRRAAALSGPGDGPAPSPRVAVEDLIPGLAENADYEVLRELGRGGMGVVYLARNRLLGREEVLKVVSGDLVDRSIVRERFLREIRNAAQLHHPNIVTAYSATRAGDRIVLAMEYVEGSDLAGEVKERGPLPVALACHYIYQVAMGLQHAHERGMVHRDIKPANLILARQGTRATVKILDFGLAKATREVPLDGGLTREGQMLGTPDYIAPEQSLDAQKADIRADIYSLGCTFYYLLTGGPPFEAQSLYEILQAHHSRDATPLNLARPDVPAELAALVAKMMAKSPGHRFQTPGEVAQALRPFIKPGQGGAVAGPSRVAPPTATRPPDPAPTVAPPAGPPKPAPTPATIDLGPDDRLAPARPAASGQPATGPPWLWISAGAGVLVLGLVVAWNVLVGPGPTPVPTPPVPAAGTPPEPPRREAPAPRIVPPPGEPPRLAVRKVQPAVEDIPTRGDLPKPPPVPTVAEPPAPGPPARPIPEIARAAEKPAPPAIRPGDIRQLRAIAGPFRPSNPGAVQPRVGFWPIATPDDMTAWQVGDPDRIEMNRDGVSLSAGPGGNLLLTRKASFRKCKLSLTLSAHKGTEAFLALRAHRGPDGWRAITARVYDDGGRIRAGNPSTDFQQPDQGTRTETVPLGKSVRIVFEINGQHMSRLVSNQETSTFAYAKTPAADYKGAVGVFVKSGTVVIHAMDVQE